MYLLIVRDSLIRIFGPKPTTLILAVIFLLVSASPHAQDCGPGGFTLNTQAAVDSFKTDHGACDRVNGDLILEFGPFVNLDGLSDIVTVVGRLKFSSTSNGTAASLSGLTSLTSLGHLIIEDSSQIRSIPAMPNLTSLDALTLFNARAMSDMSGFPGGVSSIKEINMSSLDSLQSLNGISTISGIGVLALVDNPNLSSISALAGSAFDNDFGESPSNAPKLVLRENPQLASLDGVPSILPPGVLSELLISDSPFITSLDPLAGLVEVWGNDGVGDNAALSDCSALFKVVDAVDDGFEGPNALTSDPTMFPPDVFNDGLYLDANAAGCTSISEIVGGDNGGGVFADGFEGDANN